MRLGKATLSLRILFGMLLLFPGRAYADPFKDLVMQILERDALVRGEKLSLEAARERLKPQMSVHWPELASSASTTRLLEGDSLRPSSNVSLTANAVLFNGGHDTLVRQEAKAMGQKLDLESAKKDLDRMAAIASDLLEIIAKQQSLVERERWLTSKRAILENTETRFKKGLLAGEEWLRVKVDFDNAQNQFEQGRQDLENLSRKYSLDAGALAQLSWPWLKYVSLKTASTLEKLSHSSPSLSTKVEEAALEASSLSLKAERRRHFPEFALSAGLSRSFDENRSPGQTQKSATLSVTLPLFSRFQTESQVASLIKLQSSQKNLAAYQLAEEKRRKESTLQDIRRLAQRLDSNSIISKLAKEVMEKSRAKFLQGKISANEFNLDESRYINLYDSWLLDIEKIHKHFVEICKSVGPDLFYCMDQLRQRP